jgi:predicted nucleic-acid-binding Zn-ribbon protein
MNATKKGCGNNENISKKKAATGDEMHKSARIIHKNFGAIWRVI